MNYTNLVRHPNYKLLLKNRKSLEVSTNGCPFYYAFKDSPNKSGGYYSSFVFDHAVAFGGGQVYLETSAGPIEVHESDFP
jgi:hypothetical protein